MPTHSLAGSFPFGSSGVAALFLFHPASAMMMPSAKVAPWETEAGIRGLELAEPGEFQRATGKKLENVAAVRADQIHDSVTGWAIVNMGTAKGLLTLRDVFPFCYSAEGLCGGKASRFRFSARTYDTGGCISLRLQTRQNRALGHYNGELVL